MAFIAGLPTHQTTDLRGEFRDDMGVNSDASLFIQELAATDKRLPLFQRLATVLRERIRSRRWEVGSMITSEQELSLLYGLSTGTVRKAIEQLVSEGLLQRRQGRGTYVRRPHLTGLPARYFGRAASAQGTVPESRILAARLDYACVEAARALGIEAGSEVVRLDRLRIWSEDFVIPEQITLGPKAFAALVSMPREAIGNLLYPFYEQAFGVVIAAVEDELSLSTADSTVASQLRIRAGDPVISITRVALSFDGVPVEWRISHGRADRFHFRVGAR